MKKEDNMKTIQEKAQFVLSEITTIEKEEKSIFVMIENHSEYTRELVYMVHEGMMPDDYKYSFIVECLELIINADENDIQDCIIDLEPDICTSDLTEWLNSNNSRVYYLSEVLSEMDIKDGFQLLAMAQIKEKEEVFYSVFGYLENKDFFCKERRSI